MGRAKEYYKRNYSNGYQEKIEGYLDMLKMAIQDESLEHIKYYKDKVDYFIGRQEAYIEKKQDDLFCERFGIQKPNRK
jgi:hypothetical protein